MNNNQKHIDIEIDKLTNSIENAISGDCFDTEINILTKQELKSITKGNGWKFDWKYEFAQEDRIIYKLSIKNNTDVIQGLVSCSDENDHIFMHLIESAPFNIGKNKIYVGVPGNLVAFLCKKSWDKGYEGFVSFLSKTKLVEHYEKMLGAVHIGNHKMIIFPNEAIKLIKQYFK